MSSLTIPNSITTDSNIEAAPLAENFSAIAAHANTELVNRDGTVAMTAELQLTDGNNAASKVYVDNKAAALVPPGVMSEYAGAVAPAGYLFANGAAVSRTTYAALFAAIGTVFGVGNGSTTFNVPDRRDRVGVGKGSSSLFDTLGEKGGSEDAIVVAHTHAQTLAIVAGGVHTHAVTQNAWDMRQISSVGGFPTTGDPGWLYGDISGTSRLTNLSSQWNTSYGQYLPAAAPSHSHSISGSITSAGSSGTDKNVQPYITVNYIIKT